MPTPSPGDQGREEGKPTLIKESEIRDIFTQMQDYDTQEAAKKTARYKADGEAFLPKTPRRRT